MNRRAIEIGLWAGAAALCLIALSGAWRAARGSGGRGGAWGMPAAPVSVAEQAPGAATVSAIADHDPFRLERHPSPIAYRPELEGAPPAPPAPKPPHPPLVLAGILGGPPWEALIEGIPNKEGAVLVREGDVFGDLHVRSVTRDSVIIRGADTTWRLVVRRSWQ